MSSTTTQQVQTTTSTAEQEHKEQEEIIPYNLVRTTRPQVPSAGSGSRLRWAEGVIDNEFLNRKSSKKCCIFHKKREYDESGSESEDECHH